MTVHANWATYIGKVLYAPMEGGYTNLALMLWLFGTTSPAPVHGILDEETVAQLLRQAGLQVHSTNSAEQFVGVVLEHPPANMLFVVCESLQVWSQNVLAARGQILFGCQKQRICSLYAVSPDAILL